LLTAILAWSTAMTVLLHWLPLSGYVYQGSYFIDVVRRELPLLAIVDAFPRVAPGAGSNLLGIALLLLIWTSVWVGIKYCNSGKRPFPVSSDE
jgi:hypothetical protein